MKVFFKKTFWILSNQFGINPYLFLLAIINFPRYLKDFFIFRSKYQGKFDFMPCLHDVNKEGGSTKTEYFWQDLYFAQKIHKSNPKRHVDVGSRIDGFVTHVASFREIEVFDIRDVTSEIPNVLFKKADLMKPLEKYNDYCDSLSCLHALEHFGLGRYGDEINFEGYKLGLIHMAKTIRKKGVLYLSTPVGIEKVAFNAHRIFNPFDIKNILDSEGFDLIELSWFGEERKFIKSNDIDFDLNRLSKLSYSLGMFTFLKR